MADIKRFIIDTFLHQTLVKQFVDQVCHSAMENANQHDRDKILYANSLKDKPMSAEQVLTLWKAEGYELHRSNDLLIGSKHHVDNVYDLSSIIEMICDWIAANLVRSKDSLSIEDSFLLAFESWAATIKSLDWGKILAKTVSELTAKLKEDYRI